MLGPSQAKGQEEETRAGEGYGKKAESYAPELCLHD